MAGVPLPVNTRNLQIVLFVLALSTAAFCVLWHIVDFPIYFFCDEATFAQTAFEWLHNGWRDPRGTFLPLYHEISPSRWVPMFSSYVLAVGLALFGKSVLVARSVCAVIAVLGTATTALALRNFFGVERWWTVPLIYAVTPVWFVYSRTAFDNPVAAALLPTFFLAYCAYRLRSPRYGVLAVIFGMCNYYTYVSNQIVIPLIVAALFLSDFRHHRENKRQLIPALLLALVLVIPSVRLNVTASEGLAGQLKALDSYLLTSEPASKKLGMFLERYGSAFNPTFWFAAEPEENIRHRLKGRGYLPVYFAPFIGLGILLTVARSSHPQYRALLIMTLAIPVPGSLCDQSISRLYPLVVPQVFFAVLGYEWVLSRIDRRSILSFASFGLLAVLSVRSSIDSVKNGALWYSDYSLYGLQYGARQLLGEAVPAYLREHPTVRLQISPDWANDPEPLAAFFLTPSERARIRLISLDIGSKQSLSLDEVIVLPKDQYQEFLASGKFKKIRIEKTLPYPDGTTGFYFVRLQYVDGIDQVFERERAKRRELVGSVTAINGHASKVRHSVLDMGDVGGMFDGDARTLGRGLAANPFVIDIEFPKPVGLREVRGDFGPIGFRWQIDVYRASAAQPVSLVKEFDCLYDRRRQPFGLPSHLTNVTRVRMSITNLGAGEPEHIHVYDVLLDEG